MSLLEGKLDEAIPRIQAVCHIFGYFQVSSQLPFRQGYVPTIIRNW